MINALSVLGSTGSVGTQALAVAERLCLPVRSISGNKNIELLEYQARRFRPEFVCVYNETAAKRLQIALADTNIKVGGGMSALIDCAASYADCVVTAVSGSVGLEPTLAAIDEGRRIALANKETLVCAGELVMARAKRNHAEILPVDSEHSAIFQCLEAQGCTKALKRIHLTASGGPFLGKSREQTKNVSPSEAVRHPNWSMGAKISVDSATMMNKGLEFIEAMHLFDVSPEEIKVIIHPESIIHSMVEYIDGSIIAQLGAPDMTLPIQYALTYPERIKSDISPPDFAKLSALHFYEPEPEKVPCLMLAMDCAEKAGTAPAVMSAANEMAVSLFLQEKIGYNDIYDLVAQAVNAIATCGSPDLDDIKNADEAARLFVRERVCSRLNLQKVSKSKRAMV